MASAPRGGKRLTPRDLSVCGKGEGGGCGAVGGDGQPPGRTDGSSRGGGFREVVLREVRLGKRGAFVKLARGGESGRERNWMWREARSQQRRTWCGRGLGQASVTQRLPRGRWGRSSSDLYPVDGARPACGATPVVKLLKARQKRARTLCAFQLLRVRSCACVLCLARGRSPSGEVEGGLQAGRACVVDGRRSVQALARLCAEAIARQVPERQMGLLCRWGRPRAFHCPVLSPRGRKATGTGFAASPA